MGANPDSYNRNRTGVNGPDPEHGSDHSGFIIGGSQETPFRNVRIA